MEEDQKKTIMIVEDEAPMLRILCDKLKSEGFDTLEAKDGETALDKILSRKPDLILLDIVLPKLGGLTLLKKLRRTNAYGKKVPVILLTNLSPDKEELNRIILETDPAYYLVKTNWNIEDILEKIKECLNIF